MKPRTFPPTLATSASFRHAVKPIWRTPEQEQRRDDLLDAAERLLAEKGLLHASLQEIGDAIGLPPYAIRAQFGNRDMIIEAVLDRHLDRLIDRIGVYQDHAESTDLHDRLRQAIGHLLDMLWAYRDAQRVFAAAANASPHLTRTLKLRQRHLVHFYAGLIAAAVPEAEGQTELLMPAALSLIGMAASHVLWFRAFGALTRADYAALLTHMVTDGVRAAASAGIGGWEEPPPPGPDAGC